MFSLYTSLKKQLGIGLVESIVAMALLCIGFVALLKLQAYLIGYSSNSNVQAEATVLAQKKIEELRGYQQISSSGSNVKAFDDIKSGAQTISGTASTYTMSWTVTPNSTGDNKTVDLNIQWEDRNKVTHTITLSSIIAKIDPATSGRIIGSSGSGAIQP